MNKLDAGEDYKFLAELTWPQGARMKLPCKLFLPKQLGRGLRLVFIVDFEKFSKVGRAGPCQLLAEIGDGVGGLKIAARDVRIGGGEHRFWGEGLDEGHLLGHPRTVQLTHGVTNASNDLIGSFELTRSLHLEPWDPRILHADGSIEWTRGERLQFDLADGIRLTFDHEYRYDTSKPRETKMWPELVAKVHFPGHLASGLEGLLPAVDDLLLLVSLAEGQRCACLGATWRSGEELVTLYRLDRSVPPNNPDHSMNDLLISHDDFLPYLRVSYRSLQDHPQRELLWSALTAVTYFGDSEIAEEFLRLFSALESLVLAFRRSSGFELVIDDPGQWEILQRDVKKVVRSHAILRDDAERRAMIYDNLSALNRISLRRATEALASRMSIGLEDVWPLFDSSEGVSLTQVRNMLVHGDYFHEPEWNFILTAQSSLRSIVQRFLLTMLGWSYRKSRAASYDMRWGNWREARAALSARNAVAVRPSP